MKRRIRVAIVMVLVLGGLAVIPGVRHAVLRNLGGLLVVADSIEPGDVVVISESGGAGEFQAAEIEASELYRRHLFSRVMLLMPSPDPVDEELARRGVRLENPVLSTLRQLGIPDSAMIVADAGEGGTTESTRALASWVRDHPSRVLVIIGAAHARRYRRALRRVWPSAVPPPRVTFPQRTVFRRDDWWQSRRTLRDGLFELEKLAWDFASHPWPSRSP